MKVIYIWEDDELFVKGETYECDNSLKSSLALTHYIIKHNNGKSYYAPKHKFITIQQNRKNKLNLLWKLKQEKQQN